MMKFLPLAAPLLLALTLPLAAQDSMTDAERTLFRDEVRTYLLENPEVLMEAIGVLEQRQAAAQTSSDAEMLQANAAAIFDDPASWVGGNPEGDITVVEFLDYRCSYCRKATAEVDELVKSDGNIRFIVKEYPILGEQSVLASRFAIAVLQLTDGETYKRTHDALMGLRGDVTPEALERLAGD
jgi:protein-disulfide isomerase